MGGDIQRTHTYRFNTMELSFNVAWGPISQIALPLIDVSTAVQLAVGAYGWWKARERSAGLIETIHGCGGALVPASSFSRSRYLSARRSTQVLAIAWFDGRLESVALPKASTGSSGDPGTLCLRAITTALLSLYDVESTTAVLTHIIPRRLVNYDLEGDFIEADGPFIASIRQYVRAIGTEEQCNTLRKELHHLVDEQHRKTFSSSIGQFNIQNVQQIEVPIIIGLLMWVLTPTIKRETHYYPTRSLTAWALAIMLSHLGFEITPSPVLINTEELYKEQITIRASYSSRSEVFLIAYNSAQTDFSTPSVPAGQLDNIRKQASYTPRVVPIKAIPRIIFRDIRHGNGSELLDVEHLCKVWNDTFDHAYAIIGRVQLDVTTVVSLPSIGDNLLGNPGHAIVPIVMGTQKITALTQLNPPPPPPGSRPEEYAVLFQVIAPQLERYLTGFDWSEASLCTVFWSLHRYLIGHREHYPAVEINTSWFGQDPQNWYTLLAIILATVFATCCKSLNPNLDVVARAALIEVAIHPRLVSTDEDCQMTLAMWMDALRCILKFANKPITSHLGIGQWHDIILSACTGTPMTLKQSAQRALESDKFEPCLGVYKNGVFMIMDMLLRPSVLPESTCQFQIQFGQPLQIPVNEDGFVIAENSFVYTTVAKSIEISDLPRAATLSSRPSDITIRIDLEPSWETDPRRVIFRARVNGIVKCNFSPEYLIIPLVTPVTMKGYRINNFHFASCQCAKPSDDVPVPSRSWSCMDMSQFIDSNHDKMNHIASSGEGLICVHAGRDVGAQVVCVAVAHWAWGGNNMPVIFASRCLKCALQFYDHESSSDTYRRCVLFDALQ